MAASSHLCGSGVWRISSNVVAIGNISARMAATCIGAQPVNKAAASNVWHGKSWLASCGVA